MEKLVEKLKKSASSGPMSGPIEILNMIRESCKISKRAIAVRLGINRSAVEKHLNTLLDKGVLRRIGGTLGHWEVNDEE